MADIPSSSSQTTAVPPISGSPPLGPAMGNRPLSIGGERTSPVRTGTAPAPLLMEPMPPNTDQFDAALALNPDNQDALFNRACFYLVKQVALCAGLGGWPDPEKGRRNPPPPRGLYSGVPGCPLQQGFFRIIKNQGGLPQRPPPPLPRPK